MTSIEHEINTVLKFLHHKAVEFDFSALSDAEGKGSDAACTSHAACANAENAQGAGAEARVADAASASHVESAGAEAKGSDAASASHAATSPHAANIDDYLTELSNAYGIETRGVVLQGTWYQDSFGPYLGELEDGSYVALLPSGPGYRYTDPKTKKRVRVNKKTASRIKPDAVCFYIPLPNRKLAIRDLFIFMAKSVSVEDVGLVVFASLLVTLMGMLTPAVTKLVFSGIVPAGAYNAISSIAVLLVGAALATGAINVAQRIFLDVVSQRTSFAIEAATTHRVLSLPARFFRDYSSGETVARLTAIRKLTRATTQAVFSVGLSGLLSLLYLVQVVKYAPSLLVPALVAVVLQIAVSVYATIKLAKRNEKSMEAASKLSGFMFSLISGIQKIRLTGEEARVFSKWNTQYEELAQLKYRLPRLLLWYGSINTCITALATVAFYAIASYGSISYADFLAFTSAYGMFSAGVVALLSIVDTVVQFRPMLSTLKPILEAEPEKEFGKILPAPIQGNIRIEHLSFCYDKASGRVVDDLSLTVEPGQYVGICGSTGCGKSTLLRLMLGFETPDGGSICYDNYSLDTVNLRALRSQFGVVLQDAKLINGSIFLNITLGAAGVDEKQAWKAAEAAGIAEDIRDMPMRMNTVVSHGGGGLSGGQKQRILIARALVHHPKVLFMDEATSALDNISQAHVAKSMDELHCTRIVIAHRLSTIKNCDRILVLNRGRIEEDGSYDELMAKQGHFAHLVERQQING